VSWNRRLFIRWTMLAAAVTAAMRRVAFAETPRASGEQQGAASRQATGLDVAAVRPVAEVVLPSELGRAGVERAANAFTAWIAAYRAGEELEHPYGSERIGTTAPSSAARWADQLAALDRDAQAAHRKAFAQCTADERLALVRSAIANAGGAGAAAGAPSTRMPSPLSAPHVAVAMLAHFVESTDGVNLAYQRRIDPRQCRPLADSPKLPVPLTRAGRASA